MEDLIVKRTDLPAMPMEEVKQYVDIIGDAIDALKAKRNAAGHLNADKAVIDEMDAQIREYSAMKLKAEIELGKKTAEMPAIPRGANLRPDGHTSAVGRQAALEQMGIPHQRATEYERLARHEEIVTDYIDRQLEKGETPTRSGAFKRIADELPKPKDLKLQAKSKLAELKDKTVITLEEVQEIKHNEEVIQIEENDEFFRDVMAANDKLFLYTTVWASRSAIYWETASPAEIANVLNTMDSIVNCCVKLGEQAVESLKKRNGKKGVKQ